MYGLFVIVGTHCMRMHPILSSQQGFSAEFQLRGEAPRHVVVGLPLPAPPPLSAVSLLIAFSRRGLRKAAALLPTAGYHLETIGQAHAVVDGDELPAPTNNLK